MMLQQRQADDAVPAASEQRPSPDDIVARIEAQINLRRLERREETSTSPGDPLSSVRARQWVNSHLPIGWPQMPRGLGPKLVAMLQKITRRLLRWYINPLVEQQNEFNDAVVAALQEVYRHVAREATVAATEREALRLETVHHQATVALQALAVESAPPTTAFEDATALGSIGAPPTLPVVPERHDAVLQRVLFAEQLGGQALPLLIVGDLAGELAERATALGLTVQALPEFGPGHLHAPAYSLGGLIWASGVWRYDPATCLHLLTALCRALAPGAPLVIETIPPADTSALARYVWADLAAVRPYPPELLVALLRCAGLESVSELARSKDDVVVAVHGYRGQE
jgi:hypothetical protein